MLAKALQVDVSELLKPEEDKHLKPVAELLNSNFLVELPLHFFGIDLGKIAEIIANAPLEVGAFISTLVELARNYALAEEHFYLGALRSYVELHNNHFPDLELAIDSFYQEFNFNPLQKNSVSHLENILSRQFGYKIIYDGLKKYPELKSIRSLFIPHSKKLLLAPGLTQTQLAFQFGKELGFQYLSLKERSFTSNLIRIRSFVEVLNHFNASYFSCGMLIPKSEFIKDVQIFFSKEVLDLTMLDHLLEKYHASPEMLFQRMTNVLPIALGIDKFFLLRFVSKPSNGKFKLDTALHFSIRHQPHINALNEHYCRRWLSVTLLHKLADKSVSKNSNNTGIITLSSAQRSTFINSNEEYICLTIARNSYPEEDKNVSITIGILIDAVSKSKINFLEDPRIERKIVNTTCERCPLNDCAERAAPPFVVEERNRRKQIEDTVARLLKEK